jgi:hypothetical protein
MAGTSIVKGLGAGRFAMASACAYQKRKQLT